MLAFLLWRFSNMYYWREGVTWTRMCLSPSFNSYQFISDYFIENPIGFFVFSSIFDTNHIFSPLNISTYIVKKNPTLFESLSYKEHLLQLVISVPSFNISLVQLLFFFPLQFTCLKKPDCLSCRVTVWTLLIASLWWSLVCSSVPCAARELVAPSGASIPFLRGFVFFHQEALDTCWLSVIFAALNHQGLDPPIHWQW